MISEHRRQREQGSALLIVLVFAAMIAIALYNEMPVATFEAQRQKEELLIDRGNEYKRAVQLYVRKIQSFPPTLDALENTNRMRFLRARYVDPYTGKDDWRLLHAGPGGVIVDSKVKQTGSTLPGAPGSSTGGTSASTLGSGSSVTNPFANSFDGANPNGTPSAGGNSFPQRPPAISANGGGGVASDPFANLPSQAIQSGDPQNAAALAAGQTAPYPGYPGPQVDPSNSTGSNSGSYPMGSPGRYRGSSNPTGDSNPPQYATSPSTGSQDAQNTMNAALNTNNPAPVPSNSGLSSATTNGSNTSSGGFGTASSGSTSGLGTMSGTTTGSGIAGVASKSTGKTIKIVNDQKDRSLWEFVYDMQKEANANAPGLGGATGTNNGTNGTSTNGGTTSTGSGSGGFSLSGGSPTSTSTQSNTFSSSPSNQ